MPTIPLFLEALGKLPEPASTQLLTALSHLFPGALMASPHVVRADLGTFPTEQTQAIYPPPSAVVQYRLKTPQEAAREIREHGRLLSPEAWALFHQQRERYFSNRQKSSEAKKREV